MQTVTEVAAVLKVTSRTVLNLIRRGELRRVKVGRSTRIRLFDLERYIERQTQPFRRQRS